MSSVCERPAQQHTHTHTHTHTRARLREWSGFQQPHTLSVMAMACESRSLEDQLVPHEDESVKNVQSQRLRCSSPSVSDFDCFSITSDRFSVIAGSEAESIFLDPIDLTNGAKINHGKELTATVSRAASEETAEQMMEDDLYNRVKDMIDERSPYNTPCVLDIQRELLRDRVESPLNPVDEVWPNIFIAEKSVAVNKARLKRLGITHIVNAAHGTGVYTGELFYKGMNITYLGLEVDDFAEADISPHFRTCAEFLDEALLTHRGKVLVDSMMGVSRSAVLVAAYLMIFQNMTITEALQEIRKKRAINPNEGFIKQLRQLNETLLEERDEDDFETESVSSVIDTRLCPPGAGNMLGLKANSIMAEEEDSRSVMSSVASSAAAAAWTKHDVPQAVANTPGQRALADDPGQGKDEADIDVDTMIAEWQNRNEKYQKEEWWEAQLMCDEDESLGENKQPDDLDSVTSEDVRMLKERITRPPASRAGSTTSCSSYGDFWRQRLKEIEEEAAAQYQRKEQNAEVSSEASQKQIDDDLQSILSDSSSMYNFCKKNKANLTPLERWKVKRIQFGWNKKDGEKEEKKEDSSDGEAAQSTTMEDVSLTAYQSWKLKQQKKHGSEENKDEILGITCKEDKATIKRRQRREELLEKTRKTLEESQSLCGWETESALSDASIPLSAFCAGAFPSASVFRDDTMSMLSGRSSVFPDQTRKAQPPVPQEPPVCQMGPNGEPMVNIANIQNWISNVVNETLIQKQAELMRASHGHSRASSLFGLGAEMSDGSVVDDDKASVFSRASAQSRTESVLSNRGKSQSMLSSFSSVSAPGSSRSKITTTSVPLYNLFQDQVNLNKLKMMEDDIKSDMRSKMASYERKKITEDNKRSTLYKKKRNKDEEEEKSDDLVDLQTVRSEKAKAPRDYGHSGRLNLPTSSSSSIEEWLKSVRAPESKVKVSAGDGGSEPEEAEDQSEFGFSIHRHSVSSEEDKDEEVSLATKRPSRYQTHADDE